jgi:NAD-dependent dihydropyrimidine dehydrogenase PreA subunit
MKRKIIKIDEEKCNGCGLCVPSCKEGALQIIDGKARLVSDIYCDGLGDCLGECPEGAITIEEREADAFDEKAATKHVKELGGDEVAPLACGCPGTMAKKIERKKSPCCSQEPNDQDSELMHWPVQLLLAPVDAPFLKNSDLLLTADCVPFAMADFHAKLLRGKAVVIGCPKFDDTNFYVEKLAEMIRVSKIKSLTVVHMEVPCCAGLREVAKSAISKSGCDIKLHDVEVSIEGEMRTITEE